MKNIIKRLFSWIWRKPKYNEYFVLVNGIKRFFISIPDKIKTAQAVEKYVRQHTEVEGFIAEKKREVIKVLVVPGKSINFITKLAVKREKPEQELYQCEKCKETFKDWTTNQLSANIEIEGIHSPVVCPKCKGGCNTDYCRKITSKTPNKPNKYIDTGLHRDGN